ncbi:hypothetical protein AB0G86_41295 [Streptomyces scabiei]|uniref:hypothetical protein n=1 Tax=Streptomyces scabiei TaxID=1930 RepID=UPI0033CA6956
MLAKSVKFRDRRLATVIATVCKAITHRFGRGAPSVSEPLHHELNRTARFWPVEEAPDSDDTLPVLEYGGALVFVYLDADTNEVEVSIDLDTVDPRLVRQDAPGRPVPMHITVQGTTVFRASAVTGTALATNTGPAPTTLHQILYLLGPSPADSDHPQPTDATHGNLVTALTAQGTPHRQTGDGGGEYVVVELFDSHVIHFHNPLGPDYGFDWDLTDGDAQQLLTGTLRLGAADTAHRIHHLLKNLG